MIKRLAIVLITVCASLTIMGADNTSWQGVSLGESMADVTTSIGPPLLLRSIIKGSTFSWNRTASPDAYLTIIANDDRVETIQVLSSRPGLIKEVKDPFGIALGDPVNKLESVRGEPWRSSQEGDETVKVYTDNLVAWVYLAHGGSIDHIMLTKVQKAPVSQPVHDPHDGLSISAAFILNARDEAEGVRFEDFYDSTLAGCESSWHMSKQRLILQNGKQYDAIDLSCTATGDKQTIYYDITSFYGKLGG